MKAEHKVALLAHMADHKRTTLGITEDGIWKRNGHAYSHLLPEASRELNLLETFRAPCLEYLANNRKKLHRDFHHLNSSQAFALNLFFPVLTDPAGTEALQKAMDLPGEIIDWEFEAVPRTDEETNFDVMLTLGDRSRVYVEVKLTESNFGSAKPNAGRREKLKQIYAPQLRGSVVPEMLEEKTFFRHYQLLRNLSYINDPPGSRLVLLFPSTNHNARDEANQFSTNALLPEAKSRVSALFAEDLIVRLLQVIDPRSPLAQSLGCVVQKYALKRGTPTAV
jgi:hypothetical protein